MTQEQIDRERYERAMNALHALRRQRYERLAAARVPVPPYGIDTGWAAGIAAVIAALIMAGIAFAEISDNSTGYSRAARDSWLTECQIKGRSLEECASAWDDGSTLRQIYYERVRKGSD